MGEVERGGFGRGRVIAVRAAVRQVGRRLQALPSPLLLGVIAAAWGIALAAELTGSGEVLHGHASVDGHLPLVAGLGVFLVAWQIHIAAMMLPSSLPLMDLFRRASAAQPRPHAVRAMFLGGYLAVWTAFGVLALGGDTLVHRAMQQWGWLHQRPHWLGGGVLMVAGAFQFTDLKNRCLQKCRHPSSFLRQHYQRGIGPAFMLGLRHGMFCLGCCWALMLVMFSVGISNLAWMAPFTFLMLYEKVLPGGERSTPAIGGALVALGLLVLADPAWIPAVLTPH